MAPPSEPPPELVALARLLGPLEPPPSVTTKTEWRESLARPGTDRVEPLSAGQRRTLTPAGREEHDSQRILYHLQPPFILHKQVEEIAAALVGLAIRNCRRPPGPRQGAVILGPAGTGKTALLEYVARCLEQLAVGSRRSTRPLDDHVPVVPFAMPDRPTRRSIVDLILQFFEHPLPGRVIASAESVLNQLQHLATRTRTLAILPDDLHFLRTADPRRNGPNDFIKRMMNVLNVTILGTTIDRKDLHFLGEDLAEDETSSSQTARRFSRFELRPFEAVPRARFREWRRLLTNYEEWLCLAHAQPGDLASPGLATYIHGRTQGRMVSVTHLLTTAASLAIEQGSERITSDLLDQVKMDSGAENSAHDPVVA